MNITYFLRDNGACGYYRADLPMQKIRQSRKAAIEKIEKGDNHIHIGQALNQANIIFTPRMAEDSFISALKDMQMEGKKLVIDFDDDMFNISPLSPHYKECGIEDVRYVMPGGEVVNLWEDGRNIDIKANKKRLDGVKRALEMSDMVTTTTDVLAGVFSEYNDNVKVLPNCIDPDIWQSLDMKRKDEIRLYWAGGSSHYEDWCILTDIIPEVMAKYPQVKLVLMGTKFDGTLKKIPKHKVEFHNWVPTPAYPYKSAILSPDICIIPLRNTEFNRCKSAIKWIEMGALGVPSVVSNISPYKEMRNGDNGIFIEDNDPEAWMKGISMLVEDELLRAKIGGNAYRHTMSNFDINKNYPLWINAYKELM